MSNALEDKGLWAFAVSPTEPLNPQKSPEQTIPEVSSDTSDLPGEEWREVASDRRYLVSNMGRVKSIWKKPRILRQAFDSRGYLCISLGRQHRQVHKLISHAFLGPRGKLTVNHIDGVKTNNRLDNLEYCTLADNIRAAHAMGLYPKGESHKLAKLTEDQVRQIRANFDRMNDAAIGKDFGVSPVTIWKIRRGITWKHVA